MPVLFLHVPKTAGTSFRQVLQREYRRWWEIPADSRRRDLYRLAVASRLRRYDVVMGHVTWEVGRLLPGEVRLVTWLRDPVERVISHYFFMRDHHPWPHMRARMVGVSLIDWATPTPERFPDNHQVRFLTDTRTRCPVGEDHLALALERLQAIAFGVVEHPDRSLESIAERLGWERQHELPRDNVNLARPEVSDEDRARIAEVNRLDQRLWCEAVRLLG